MTARELPADPGPSPRRLRPAEVRRLAPRPAPAPPAPAAAAAAPVPPKAEPIIPPTVLFWWVVLFLAALYVRFWEMFGMVDMPIVQYISAGAILGMVGSMALNPRAFWDQPQDRLFLFYYLAIVLSNMASGWFEGGVNALNEFMPVVLCYFLIRLGTGTDVQVRRVTRLLVWLSVFLAVNGLMQVFTGTGLGISRAMETKEGIRIQGTGIFADPNDLGLALVTVVPFVLTSAIGKGTRFFSRVLHFAFLCAILLACFYTNSRGTMLGLCIVFGARAIRRYGIAVGSIAGSIAVVALLALGPSRMSEMSADEASAQGRIQAWAAGMQMFKGSPLFGIGYGRFGEVHGLVAHNGFVHVLGELGLMGAVPFVGMFYWHFRRLRTRPGEASPEEGDPQLHRDLTDAALGLLACCMFLSRQYIAVPFIVLALGASLVKSSPAGRPPEPTVVDTAAIFTLTLVLVAIFHVIAVVFGGR